MCVPDACRSQKKAPDPQDLELELLWKPQEELGFKPGPSRRAASLFNCWVIPPATELKEQCCNVGMGYQREVLSHVTILFFRESPWHLTNKCWQRGGLVSRICIAFLNKKMKERIFVMEVILSFSSTFFWASFSEIWSTHICQQSHAWKRGCRGPSETKEIAGESWPSEQQGWRGQ